MKQNCFQISVIYNIHICSRSDEYISSTKQRTSHNLKYQQGVHVTSTKTLDSS